MRSKVLISGAAGGLGKAFAVECARRGWDLFLTDLHPGPLDTLGEALERTYGINIQRQACNLMDPENREKLFEAIRDGNHFFRGLINVAGLDVEGIFLERTQQEIQGIVRLNVEGTLTVTHRVLERMDPMQPFWMITVSSLAAFYPMPVKATYAASKRFLLDFFLALRDEVSKQGASVTVLCPAGLPTTPGAVSAIEAQGFLGLLTTQNIGWVAKRSLDHAVRGTAIFVPGLINQILRWLGGLVPPRLLSGMIGRRWRAARKSRPDPLLPVKLGKMAGS